MKKLINIFFLATVVGGLLSCSNTDWEFDDFEYTTTYFPYQSPLRTLILDETYAIDNSNDLQLKFLISAAMGGVYKNQQDVQVGFEIDESLTQGLVNVSGKPILPLPQEYYSIKNADNKLVIPSGKFSGSIEVQLTDEFLQDSLAVGLNYVIPVKITSTTTDSILVGRALKQNPDPRNPVDWEIVPKNYTLFGIKYINKYHGTYLLRGKSEVRDSENGTLVEEVVYKQKDVINDEVVRVNTIFKNSVVYGNSLRLSNGSPGSYEFTINFDANNNGAIVETKNSDFPVTGSAQFKVDGDEWGGKKRNAIYLDYMVDDGNYMHNIKDTLVFRDKNVVFEEFEIKFQ